MYLTKKLCRFYCLDCDNAFMDVLELTDEKVDFIGKCEYCGKSFEAEYVQEQKDFEENEN